ncbi:SpoIIE family protein phosphatase [Streptomyces anulatus]
MGRFAGRGRTLPDERPSGEGSRRIPGFLDVRSVAGQVFVFQAVIVLLLVATAVVELFLQYRQDYSREARNRSLAVAEAFAHSPGLPATLAHADPSAVLQPLAEETRKATGVDFVVVMNSKGIRYTHPNPSLIGKPFIGTIQPALRGHALTETFKGTLGQSVRAVVPVTNSDGSVVGLVAAGITVRNVSSGVNRQLPVLFLAAAVSLALATTGTALVSRRLRRQTHGLGPAGMTRLYEHHDAVLHSVREGVLIVSGDGRLILANDEARRLLNLPEGAEGQHVTGLGLGREVTALLASGRIATDELFTAGERLLTVNNRSTERYGGMPGTAATLRDSTELVALSERAELARRRLRLLYDASVDIGTTLDVTRTAEELAHFAVPRFADFATVDLAEPVLRGDEPPPGGDARMVRTAFGGVRKDAPLYPSGELIIFAPSTLQASVLDTGQAVLVPSLSAAPEWQAQDPDRAREVLEYGIHSLITAPLRARGVLMGMVHFWRRTKPEPFEEDDLSLAEELAARAAVCIDNARRYTREHDMAVTLQHSLLPRGLPVQGALDVARRYLPAQAGVGGDWFDVIPLSGARVALVVGDVVGHGINAAAAMGRLRAAVHTLADMDLPPDEILAHLDDLATRIVEEESSGDDVSATAVLGATCLYVVYDPVTRRCTMARAGHPPPVVVSPAGTATLAELPPGPPLGIGTLPFESAELELAEGSLLALYTDGLLLACDRDIDVGLSRLRDALACPERSLENQCSGVIRDLLTGRQTDDVALLLARTHSLDADHVVSWDLPRDPAAVSKARAHASRVLQQWHLEELEFTTALIVSELVTNAIRYGGDPIRMRLIRQSTLICEVADGSSTSPRLRHARTTDEGGRGLFLIAQMARRWGTRYTAEGKIIWAEQSLPSDDAGRGP